MGKAASLLLALASFLSFFQFVIGHDVYSSDHALINTQERSLPITGASLDDRLNFLQTRSYIPSDSSLDGLSIEPVLEKRKSHHYPLAFDANIGTNFTSKACPNFFKDFLRDKNVRACLPVSLMLQTSGGWFDATKSVNSLHRVLDKACAADGPGCTSLLNAYAAQLVSDGACKEDYEQQNPIVLQAYNGLLAFPEIFNATCLKNTDKSEGKAAYHQYCFINAATNRSAPASSFIYYLPVDVPLPAVSKVVCDSCLQRVMAGFAISATNASLPISRTYPGAASVINSQCGSDFVQSQVKIEGAAPRSNIPTRGAWAAATLTLLFVLLS